MGEIYRADDLTLGPSVALEFPSGPRRGWRPREPEAAGSVARRVPRPVEARRERGRDLDADGQAGFQVVDRQDPRGRPETAAPLHPITPPRTQEPSAGMRGVLAPIGAVR
jgi:hypothetical protein